jgi:phosphoglycerate kinase
MSDVFRDVRKIKDLKGKRVLVRASLNTPIDVNGNIVDDFRIQKALPTIQYLKNHDAKVIICGHLGRDANETLLPISKHFNRFIDVKFVPDILGPEVKNAVSNMQNGDVILLENLRREAGEKANDETFARALSEFADIYVNDAFSVSHREHASIVGVPQFIESYAGILFQSEYDKLEYARSPDHPSLFILGGAKFATKQPLIEKFLTIYDHVFVTGALANDFFLAEGIPVGRSLVSDPPVDVRHLLNHPKIILPSDVMVLTEKGEKVAKKPKDVVPGDMINDSGPETMKLLEPIIREAKYILWNGPTGDYQLGFTEGTRGLVELINNSSASAIVGGGDTMSQISKYGYMNAFSFCSTAGGAMLEFLLRGTIPGIEALKSSPKVS